MACDQDSLRALDLVVNEFYHCGSNTRKREIEVILAEFKRQPHAWKQSLYYLTQSPNQFLSMFCLLTLETVVHKQWETLPMEVRDEICSTLYHTLLESHRSMPSGVRNKLVKLIVDIARSAWPHLYPDFLTNVLSLSQNADTSTLCLIFVKTISEELSNPREDLLYERKVELNKLLLQNVGSIIEILNGFLDALVEKNRNVATATPPPSPTQGSHSPSPARGLFGSDLQSSLHSNSLMQSIMNRRHAGYGPNVAIPTLDSECCAIAGLTLECIAHLFSWVPLDMAVNPHLLENVFIFASMGPEAQSHIGQEEDSHKSVTPLGVLGMGVINEVLGKNYIPNNLDEFLVQTFQTTSQLVHKITTESILSECQSMYKEKICDFLRLFVCLHLKRFENNPQFPILSFLELLYRFTFLQRQSKTYIECLSIWDMFLDHLLAKNIDNPDYALKYKDALSHLSRNLLSRIQFRQNRELCMEMSYVVKIHTSGYDDEEELYEGSNLDYQDEGSEFRFFVTQNLETLAKIADLFPSETLVLIFEPFTATTKEYLSLQNTIMDGLHLKPMSDSTIEDLHCLLRDTSTFLQAVGRFSTFFLGKNLMNRSTSAFQVIERLFEMVNFTMKFKLFQQKSSNKTLHEDFVEVYAQILWTMKAWTYWLSQLYSYQFANANSGADLVHHLHQTCNSINKQMLHAGIEAVTCGAPLYAGNCGAQLLSSLSVLVKSPIALEMNEVHNLYTNLFSIVSDPKIRKTVSRCLVNILLLPWPSYIENHRMEARQHHLASFVNSYTKEFISIDPSTRDITEYSETVKNTLSLVRSQVDELNGTDKQTRETFYQCIRPVIEKAVTLFPVFSSMLEPCHEILSVILVSMDVMMHQMGNTYTLDIIQRLFEGVYTNDIINKALKGDDRPASNILEKFLDILELVSREPGASFKKALPNTIALCMDMVYPLVEEIHHHEVMVNLFRLLFTILDHNWKYFFRGVVKSSLGPKDFDACQNADRFIQILRAFGKTLLSEDLTLFKQNLHALEELNKRYKLYHRGIFKSNVLGELITVLIRVLLNGSLDSLTDEICVAVYNMASVDFNGFFYGFLPHFVDSCEGMKPQQKEILNFNFSYATDLPTFTQNLARFVNDTRVYSPYTENLYNSNKG